MVLPDENATTRQTNQMSDMTLNNVFLSPGIRLSDLDTQRTGASSSSRLPRSRRVGEWVSVPETEDVDIQDAEEQDDDPKRTITALDDDSKRTITVRDSSSPEKVDPSNAAATAGSKRSLGDFEETPSPWLSSSGKTDGGDTTESARSKRSKRSADSEETVTATSRASSSSNGADGSLNTTRAGSKTSGSAVGSGSSASARTPTTQSSQRSSAVPPALDGTSEQRGSSSVGPSSIINTILTTNTTTNKGKGKASIHDLSAASYLARHQAQIAQNHIVISASPQHPAAATASSSSASAPPPSIVLSPPAETSKKKQTLILENRFLQNQLIEQNFQALWTRRENFLRFFTKAHGITLDVTLDAKKKKMNPAEGGAKDNDKNDDDDDDDADKRKDSFESSSSPPAKSKPPDFATLLARARERALELLLEAWYEKLGTRATPSDGWTKYNEKTTTSAVLKLRSILATGDTDLRIPIAFLSGPKQVNWKHKLASVRFWFVSVNQAVDFLSAFGIGDSRFGSGVSRVEVLQYSLEDSGGKCLSETHHASERAWKGGLEGWMPNEFPPVRLCPCSEYKLLMKIVGGAQKLPEPGGERAIRWMSERLTREWQKANLAAGVDVARDEWPSEVGERNMPLVLSIGGVPGFGLWHCLGRDVERRMLCRTIRLEGRFAELL